MVFGNGVKNLQAAAYNGARTVYGMFLNTAIINSITQLILICNWLTSCVRIPSGPISCKDKTRSISHFLLREEWLQNKECLERRLGESFKFLFLPKMGLLGSKDCNKKNLHNISCFTGDPPLTQKLLTRFPLPRFSAYVCVSGRISVSRGPQYHTALFLQIRFTGK